MAFELDHLFICTDSDAPVGDRLVSFGLTEGTPHIHAGQGTANRRFFFRNSMLELLWIHSPEEAQSETTRSTHLWERWRDRNQQACPFGFCLRPAEDSTAALPFSTWSYRPTYLPEALDIAIGTNANVLTEPMLFYLSFRKRQDAYAETERQPLEHGLGLSEMTRVTFVSPYANHCSPELKALVDYNLIQLRQGETYRLELGFDGEKQGKSVDFRPDLPLIVSW